MVCSYNGCTNESFGSKDKCALHCSKNEYAQDFNSGLLHQFFKEFSDYITKPLLKTYHKLHDEFTENEIADHLRYVSLFGAPIDESPIAQTLKSKQIAPRGIVFPSRDSRDDFDYEPLLNLFGDVWFIGCEFYICTLNMGEAQCFFQDCIFHEQWILQNYKVLQNIDSILYQLCDFKQGVHNSDVGRFSERQFCFNCRFQKIELFNAIFEQSIFWDEQGNASRKGLNIENLRIEKCVFNEKFIINNHQILNFNVQDSLFKGKFEFKNNQIHAFIINNTNFEKLVDCFSSTFKEFSISKCIFDDFVGFEQCVFDGHGIPDFKYATFLSFVNFRQTNFLSGLDLGHVNLKETPNFLNSSINRKKTNRETLRVIKHSFEKSGNSIDGGKYFSYEMAKYQEELSQKNWRGNFQEKLVFFANKWISDFGQNFILPIIWIVFLSILYQGIIYLDECNVVLQYAPCLTKWIKAFNGFAKNILPFKNFLRPNLEFVSLIFYVIFSSLVWQTISSIKMHTKRN